MLHKPSTSVNEDYASKKKSRLGILFFFIYFFLYGGFVIIGVVNYELLAVETLWGLNLATLYGIALIVFAVLLGGLYNFFCSRYEDEAEKELAERSEQA
ncbi:DUF485 domain-containing protein [Albibacterium profundi]|uniref:DUF485 domain-containing protein n=1 Tax=Albibacterium profundi TaxID=3134906 RepID=A0ABV5CGZ8_9SPHI